MKLRVETSEHSGAIVEYEGEGALELAKLVLAVLLPERTRLELEQAPPVQEAPLKVLDWGQRAKTGAVEAIRELWGETPERAKKWVVVAPLLVSVPPGFARASVLERLRTAGVTVE